MKNYQIILTSFLSFFVAVTILDGTAAKYIPFAGPMNELGCAVIALTMGCLSFFAIDWKSFVNFLNK
jgi:hypothetical protein